MFYIGKVIERGDCTLYKTIKSMECTIDRLFDNTLFWVMIDRIQKEMVIERNDGDNKTVKSSFEDVILKRSLTKKILEDSEFEDIYRKILEGDVLKKTIMEGNIVQCLFPEFNEKNENLFKIYNKVGFDSTSGEIPVFFADNSILNNRNSGLLVTNQGLYQNKKNMIPLKSNMQMEIDYSEREIYVRGNCVFTFSGSKKDFYKMINLLDIVYIFNVMRCKIS